MTRLYATRFAIPLAALCAVSASAFAQTAPATITNIFDGADPGTITVAGITVYGTLDVGGAYLNHAASRDSLGGNYIGQPYILQSNSQRSRFTYQNNAFSQSNLGVRSTQSLSDLTGVEGLKGWSVGFDAAVNFDPLYGELADLCKSVQRNNGAPPASQQVFAADGSRCGQLFSGDSWVSLKNNDGLGELRFGRQLTLLGSTLASADPTPGSYAFSLFGFSGTVGAGAGATEESRWNNSLKYLNTIGIVRVGAAYRFEGGGQGGDGYSFQGGVDLPGALKGLSIDGVYAKENTAITVGSLSAQNCFNLEGNAGAIPAAGLSAQQLAACQSSNVLAGTVQDTEAWAIAAKYKFGEDSFLKNATVMGGYELITRSNPSDRLSSTNTIGGYQLLNIGGANTPNYNGFVTDRDFDVYWIGGKYAFTPKLTGTAAWYHQQQNTNVAGAAGQATGLAPAKPTCTGLVTGRSSSGTCSGALNFYSATLDYQLAKRLDLYTGVSWSDVSNGAAAGFLATNSYNLVSGVRFRF